MGLLGWRGRIGGDGEGGGEDNATRVGLLEGGEEGAWEGGAA